MLLLSATRGFLHDAAVFAVRCLCPSQRPRRVNYSRPFGRHSSNGSDPAALRVLSHLEGGRRPLKHTSLIEVRRSESGLTAAAGRPAGSICSHAPSELSLIKISLA